MEESFPRGRRRRLSEDANETEAIPKKSSRASKKKQEAQKKREASDFLFGTGPNKERKVGNDNPGNNKRHKRDQSPHHAVDQQNQQRSSLLPIGGGGVITTRKNRGERIIESLGFSKLRPGLQLLSVVREVHEDLAVFSLPNHWTGFMLRPTSSSWACDEMLQVGQMMCVTVVKAAQEATKTGPRRRIQVSCMPGKVNSTFANGEQPKQNAVIRGQIKTVEDHGVLIDVGFSQVGFLSFDDIEGKYYLLEDNGDDDKDEPNLNNEKETAEHLLGEGRVLDFLVKTPPSARNKNTIMKLGLQSQTSRASQITLADQLPSVHALRPGIMVHANVEALAKNGVCVAFSNGAYRGAIEGQHLGSFFLPKTREESTAWREVFDKAGVVTSRVIAVDATTKIVRLSLIDHLLHLTPPPKQPDIGTVFAKATVLRCDPGIGALLALPEPLPSSEASKMGSIHAPPSKSDEYVDGQRVQVAYVHVSKAVDDYDGGKDKVKEAAFAKDFAPSTKHKIRILATSNLIEGFSSAAAAPSIVGAHVFQYDDLLPGNVYKQVPICGHLDSGGVRVDFGLGIRGLIPSQQLFDQSSNSDYRSRIQKVKYAINSKIDVRVIKVDVEARKCILTAKKTLVSTKHMLKSFEDLKVGQLGTGFVSKVSDRGLHVAFFNGVYGLIPTRNLRKNAVEGTYGVGDVIQCRILNAKCFKNKRKETSWDVTLAIATDENDDIPDDVDMEKENSVLPLQTARVLPKHCARVVQIKSSRERAGGVGVIPGCAILEFPTKMGVENYDKSNMPSTIECKIHFDQILDRYEAESCDTPSALDAVAHEYFKLGELVDAESMILFDPKKTVIEHRNGTGKFVTLSLRPQLIQTCQKETKDILVPKPGDHLFVGAVVQGFVSHLDPRHGAFVSFLDGLTGLVPKAHDGLSLRTFDTVKLRIAQVDPTVAPPKLILTAQMKGKLPSRRSTGADKEVKFGKGDKVSGVVSRMAKDGSGFWVDITPSLPGFVSAVDASKDIKVMEDLKAEFRVGQQVTGYVLDKRKGAGRESDRCHFVTLALSKKLPSFKVGSVVYARVNRRRNSAHPPSLILDLPGKKSGRCCITELADRDDWTNFPLGNPMKGKGGKPEKNVDRLVSGDGDDSEADPSDQQEDHDVRKESNFGLFPHGKVVKCCILKSGKDSFEVSCRKSRINGGATADEPPSLGDKVPAYVDNTNSKGCFLRISRHSEARVMIKELTDGFVPDPVVAFPPGRLVLGRIKGGPKASGSGKELFDVDLRESSVSDKKRLTFDDIQVGDKYMGSVSRIEDYGAFVRIDRSDVAGLVHKSECSENYIAEVSSVYDPGDLVKVLVIRKDVEKKQLAFSMKASHFADDSTDESESEPDESGDEMEVDGDDTEKVPVDGEKEGEEIEEDDSMTADDEGENSGNDDDSSSDDESDDGTQQKSTVIDTNVGFDWSGGSAPQETLRAAKRKEITESSSEEDGDDSDSDSDDGSSETGGKARHSSKRTQVARRKEERATSQREAALADGTADENPETSADFERLLASDPNSSELWIRYMAFHLTLADIGAARKVAEKAFSRIEFREEGSKLNVWCALLTIEVKYGNEDSVDEALTRACQQVNPKHIHLRLCEILEKEGSTVALERANALYQKMCRRFRSKKKAWIAYAKFLLYSKRLEEAFALSKRALKSLPTYKHIWLMSHFGQLLYENKKQEQARAVFEALLRENPRRSDLLSLFLDQEVKHGEIQTVRQICSRVSNTANPDRLMKFNDKQMKKFFKKWFSMEEKNGSLKDCDAVKEAARQYIESSSVE